MEPTVPDTTAVAETIVNSGGSTFEKIINMMILDPARTEVMVLWIFLIGLIVGVIWLLSIWSRDESNDIIASDLICTDGKINESKMARFGAFLVSTWAFVFLIVTDRMTEWYFVGYMAAWVGNALASKYMNDKKSPSEPESEPSDQDGQPDASEDEPVQDDPPRKRRRSR